MTKRYVFLLKGGVSVFAENRQNRRKMVVYRHILRGYVFMFKYINVVI